jgi:hypothetical protein
MRFKMVVMLGVPLIACASSRARPAQTTAVASSESKPTLKSNAGGPAAKGKYICDYEEDTGSHMRQKVCRYVEDTEGSQNSRNQTQDNWREFMNHSLGPKGG